MVRRSRSGSGGPPLLRLALTLVAGVASAAPPRCALAQAPLVAWVPTVAGTAPPLADAMARIPPAAPPQGAAVAHVYAARGGVEGFALIVRAPPGAPLARLQATASPLVGPGRARIPSEHVEIYRALYQTVRAPSGAGERPGPAPGTATSYRPSQPDGPKGSGTLSDPGQGSMCGVGRPFGPPPCFIPDGLVPYKRCSDGSAPPCPGDAGTPLQCAIDGRGCGPGAPPMVVPPGRNQQLWVEITVPRGARGTPAGTYRGRVKITSDAGSAEIQVALHVWDFELPASPSFRTAFGSNTAPLDGPARYGWITNEQDYLAKHEISSVRYGTSPADAAAYDRSWRELKARWGVPNAVAAPFWSDAIGPACGSADARHPSAAELSAWKAARHVPPDAIVYLHDGDEIFKEVQARCDGSTYAAIRRGAGAAHAAGVRVLTVVNPIAELAPDPGAPATPPVDIFVASPRELFRESRRNVGYRGRDVVSEATAAGAQLWTYNIWLRNSWGPKWLLDYSPVAYRLGFLAQALGISGALVAEYWTGAQRDENPWTEGVYRFMPGGDERTGPMNGDSQFIYPGAPIGLGPTPTAHLRLKMLRDGIEDYELIAILRSLHGGRAYASGRCPGHGVSCKALVEAIGGTDYSDYSTDSAALQRARKAIGDLIAIQPDRPRG